MSEQRRIVVGTDGSENGRRALEWALRHAQEIGASVEVVTAWTWDTVTRLYGAVGGAEHAWAQVKRRQQEDLSACLEGLVDPPRVSLTTVEGDPVEVLAGAARDASLLVLGSHGLGHHPLRRALLGSVAEGCIRNSATPVVVVPNHRGTAKVPATRGVTAMAP